MTIAHGKIIEDGQILFDDVEVQFKETMRGSLKDWYGRFLIPQDSTIGVGGPYRLELNDGRCGDIIIKPAQFSSSAERTVSFQGSGPLA